MLRGTAVAQWLLQIVWFVHSIPAGVSGFFIDIKSFRSHYGPGVDTASNRNEYREYFLGGKGGRCVRLTTYHHPVPLSRNLGALTSWNPMGLSRPVMGLICLFAFYVEQGVAARNWIPGHSYVKTLRIEFDQIWSRCMESADSCSLATDSTVWLLKLIFTRHTGVTVRSGKERLYTAQFQASAAK